MRLSSAIPAPLRRGTPPDSGSPRALPRKQTSNAVWFVLAAAASQGVTFGSSLLVANALGREAFGEFSTLQRTHMLSVLAVSFAIGAAATQYLGQFSSADPGRAARIRWLCSRGTLCLALLGMAAFGLGGRWIAASVLNTPHLSSALLLVAVSVPLGAAASYQTAVLTGLQRIRPMAIGNLISGALYLAACGPIARIYGVRGAIAALVCFHGLQWLLLLRADSPRPRESAPPASPETWAEDRSLIVGFAAPAAAGQISTSGAQWLSLAILFRQPDGAAEMASYSVAFLLRTMVIWLPFVATNYYWSVLNRHIGDADPQGFRRTWWFNIRLNLLLVIAIGASAALLGPFLLGMFGREFRGELPTLLIILLSALPECLAVAVSLPMLCRGHMWRHLSVYALPRDASLLIAALILCPMYGSRGLAMASLVGAVTGLTGAIIGTAATRTPRPAADHSADLAAAE